VAGSGLNPRCDAHHHLPEYSAEHQGLRADSKGKEVMNQPRLRPLAAATALFLFAGLADAAQRDELHRTDLARLNHEYRLATGVGGAATSPAERHAELLGLEPESRLQVINHRVDRDGTHYYRYQQTFRGMPVFGEQVVVSEGRGQVRNLFGRRIGGLAAEVPRGGADVGAGRALSIARQAALGDRQAALRSERERATRSIYVGDDGRARVAYVVSFFADRAGGGAPTRPFVIVDAASGRVLAVERAESGQRPVWRVKILTARGEVRVVIVDAASGRVIG
jgi:Zn-dependent metalloprotease